MIDNQQKTHITRGTFAIDIQYQGKEFYALVIPEPPVEGSHDYHVMIPWLFNFKLGYTKQIWVVLNDEPVDAELLEVVSKEIAFVCTIG